MTPQRPAVCHRTPQSSSVTTATCPEGWSKSPATVASNSVPSGRPDGEWLLFHPGMWGNRFRSFAAAPTVRTKTPVGCSTSSHGCRVAPRWQTPGGDLGQIQWRDRGTWNLSADAEGANPQPLFVTAGKLSRRRMGQLVPDGQWIACTSTRDDNAEFYLLKAGRFRTAPADQRPRSGRSPEFSPDGKRIAFCHESLGRRKIAPFDRVYP